MGPVRNYLIVTGAYWGFTLTDGALRMLILLHFYTLGYTPFQLASLFLLYELAGIFANLGGGWLAARFGITRMLSVGLSLQVTGLLLLSALSPDWSSGLSLAWVVAAQGVAGVTKDLTKTASKSAIKATSEGGAGQLYRWVAWFTGSKNAMKGVGFFLGGLLLQAAGFRPALWIMAGLLVLALAFVLRFLPPLFGRSKSSRTVRELFAKDRAVNLLAAARVFMFGARDVWFVVALPVFLYAHGWRFIEVSAFVAGWTIAYGGIQAVAPALTARSPDGLSREIPAARLWALALAVLPALIALALWLGLPVKPDLLLVVGLSLFGIPFAVNSSLHSYLILAYAGSEKAAEDVGFYYAANAAGRLGGILLSGLLYQAGGIILCLVGSATMVGTCFLITLLLPTRATAASLAA